MRRFGSSSWRFAWGAILGPEALITRQFNFGKQVVEKVAQRVRKRLTQKQIEFLTPGGARSIKTIGSQWAVIFARLVESPEPKRDPAKPSVRKGVRRARSVRVLSYLLVEAIRFVGAPFLAADPH